MVQRRKYNTIVNILISPWMLKSKTAINSAMTFSSIGNHVWLFALLPFHQYLWICRLYQPSSTRRNGSIKLFRKMWISLKQYHIPYLGRGNRPIRTWVVKNSEVIEQSEEAETCEIDTNKFNWMYKIISNLIYTDTKMLNNSKPCKHHIHSKNSRDKNGFKTDCSSLSTG